MQGQAFIIPFAEDNAGNPCTVPSTAVKLRIRKKRGEGKPGRPKLVCIDNAPFEPALPVTVDTVSSLPDGDYIADAVDANGQRVGERILFSIEHLHAPGTGAEQPAPGELSGVYAQLMEMNKRLQQQTEALHETLLKTTNQVCVALEKMTTAQVELTKHLAPVIEAAATTVESARTGGFSKMFEELREIWDSMPEQSNNLQAVLSSPLIAGLAHTLQKFVAEAASNAAERVAGGGEPSDTEAARAGRRYHQLRMEQERRKAQGE